MGKGSGFGKTILFGEHFVVYGLPALASAIGSRTEATVIKKEGKGYNLNDDRPEVLGYKKKKFDEQKDSIKRVLDFMEMDLENYALDITLAGDLVCASGVGASAAGCVAMARAITEEFNLDWGNEQINAAAYEGEKGYHGTPSGIDNTASTYGGLVHFIKNLEGGPNTMDPIKLETPVELVIASSGKTANTKVVVGDVRKKKEENPEWFDKIVEEYKVVFKEGREALIQGDWTRVGEMMNKNHELLQQITVSNDELDKMTKIAREAGALGSKLTGTGRGGNMISLTPGKALQDKVAKALGDSGHLVWRTTIGG